MKLCCSGFVAGAVLAVSMAAFAADGTNVKARSGKARTTAGTTTANPNAGKAEREDDKIASEFTVFAGSRDNANRLVASLRQGSEVTLTSPAGNGQTGTSTAFTPPTPPMDGNNVRISLALAQEQLIRLGITRPTPEQLNAVLTGGTLTRGAGSRLTTVPLQGVLQMRAQGMGWGQIASAMGTKLGHVMGGLKQTNQQLAAGRPVPGVNIADSAGVTIAAGTGNGTLSARGQGREERARTDGETVTGVVAKAMGSPAATSSGLQTVGDGPRVGVATEAGTDVGGHASPPDRGTEPAR